MSKSNYVVTIAREFGSMGRPIAKRVAEELGIEYYDRDLVELAAEAMKVNVGEIASYDEHMNGRFGKMIYPFGGNVPPIHQNRLFEVQKSIIMDINKNKRPCVIVGRCADDILKDCENILRVFIYAPYEMCKANCISEFKMEEAEAVKMIEKIDRGRSTYYKYYTNQEFDNRENRDLLINSGILGIEGSVSVIKAAVLSKFSD